MARLDDATRDRRTVDALRADGYALHGLEGERTDAPPEPDPHAPRRPVEEFVVQKNGQVRQAGASAGDTVTIRAFRERAERDLFTFAFGVLDQWWLYPPLHRDICQWLQRVPPYRKALMVPRGHAKSTIVCQALPLHMLTQPAESNIYYPGFDGGDTRVLLAGEKIERAQDHLRVIEDQLTTNALLRALWPAIMWENPKRQAKKWNDTEMIVRRTREWPDPSIRAIGVGGAITGAHPNCLIKDDITTEAAANSPVVMQAAIRWHENVRALLVHTTDLEFISGTRWAVGDLLDYIDQNDPTVEMNPDWREIVRGGAAIYPHTSANGPTGEASWKFGAPGAVEQLQRQHGAMFWLLYMNSVGDSALVDFNEADLRGFELRDGVLWFTEDERDSRLAAQMHGQTAAAGMEPPGGGRGMSLNAYLDHCDRAKAGGSLGGDRLAYIKGARSRGPSGAATLEALRKETEG